MTKPTVRSSYRRHPRREAAIGQAEWFPLPLFDRTSAYQGCRRHVSFFSLLAKNLPVRNRPIYNLALKKAATAAVVGPTGPFDQLPQIHWLFAREPTAALAELWAVPR